MGRGTGSRYSIISAMISYPLYTQFVNILKRFVYTISFVKYKLSRHCTALNSITANFDFNNQLLFNLSVMRHLLSDDDNIRNVKRRIGIFFLLQM